MTDIILDVRGLSCPLPVLKANRILRELPGGTRLRILATDRASVTDFQVFCRETGHALVSFADENGIFSFTIKRRSQVV
ncbi:MAG: sulfurtransferase TusA family protein [Acetobacter syzygii]|uniref:sulfurtransferase TusA family protein n=1 Tax=Acetobacter syzygii TaxID=146476 RepID=UPI0039E8D4AB